MSLTFLTGSLQVANADGAGGSETQSNDQRVAVQGLACTPGTVYAISGTGSSSGANGNGQLQQITNGTVTLLGRPAGGEDSMNGLGIGSGGTSVYAYKRLSYTDSYGNKVRGVRLYQYNVSAGTWSAIPGLQDYYASTAQNGNFSGTFVAGAVNLRDGNYFFGGFTTVDSGRPGPTRYVQTFKLWQYDVAGNRIRYLGSVDTGAISNKLYTVNGDIAFDADGNLFIVRGYGAEATIFSVTAGNLIKANGGTIPSSVSSTFNALADVNGVAFDQSGKAYLGTNGTLESFDMPDWANEKVVTTSLQGSSDLASCSSPPTITLEKVVNGRAQPTDQFELSLYGGGNELGSAITAGSSNGLQDEHVGPLPTSRDRVLTFKETSPDGAAGAELNAYTTSYACVVDNGTQITSGSGTEGSVTIPQTGQAVVCRFTNSPLPLTAHVNVSKTILGPDGGTQPGAGWTLSSSTTATSGTAVQDPAHDQQADANGLAQWSVNFGGAGSRATIHVAETQRQGYDFANGQCVVTDANGVIGGTIPIASASGVDVPNVKPGATVDCTLTNKVQKASLTIVKSVIQKFGGAATPDDFKLVATPDGKNAIPFKSGVVQNVDPGTYAIGETQLPGYEQDGAVVCVADGKNMAVTDAKVDITSGQSVTCTLTNKDKPGSLVWSKTDGAAAANSLGGSQWTITPKNDSSHPILITDNTGQNDYRGRDADAAPGAFTVDGLSWGEYTLKESRAPAGYELDATNHDFTVTADRLDVKLGAIVDKQKTPPSLPFTGGMSVDEYRIGGAILVTLAVGCGWALRRRAMLQTS